MTFALVTALLFANPTPADKPATDKGPDAAAAFERLKKLEGNWRSKDGQVLALRVVQGQAVVEQLTQAGKLVSVTVYRLEGGELLATVDADSHGALKLTTATAQALKFDGHAAGLTLTTPNADLLKRELKAGAVEFSREYVDTLK
jgi:hypothetical protein